jgi:hypothetical protein
MADYRPINSERWASLGKLWAGTLAGWIATPGIWLAVWGPRRYLAMVSAMAFCESRYSWSAENESETAQGILQYITPTWEALWPIEHALPHRDDEYAQGYAVALYIRDRTLNRWGWTWRLAVPVYGYAALRWIWTHEPKDTYPSWEEMIEHAYNEQCSGVEDCEHVCWYAFRWWNFWTLIIGWLGFVIPIGTLLGFLRWGRGT